MLMMFFVFNVQHILVLVLSKHWFSDQYCFLIYTPEKSDKHGSWRTSSLQAHLFSVYFLLLLVIPSKVLPTSGLSSTKHQQFPVACTTNCNVTASKCGSNSCLVHTDFSKCIYIYTFINRTSSKNGKQSALEQSLEGNVPISLPPTHQRLQIIVY